MNSSKSEQSARKWRDASLRKVAHGTTKLEGKSNAFQEICYSNISFSNALEPFVKT